MGALPVLPVRRVDGVAPSQPARPPTAGAPINLSHAPGCDAAHSQFVVQSCHGPHVGPIDALRDQLREVIALSDVASSLPSPPRNAAESTELAHAITEGRDAFRVLLVMIQRFEPTTEAEKGDLAQLMQEVGRATRRVLESSMAAGWAAAKRTRGA